MNKLSDALAPLDDAGDKVVSTTEEYVRKGDDLILDRVMRVVDHAPAFVTLKALADAGGISASLSGIASDPEAFAGLDMALDVPTVMFNIWTAICAFQALSLAKSALASDGNELSQRTITALSMSNWAAARMIGSDNLLRDTILTAVISGYAVRNGSAAGEASLHNMSLQLMSSFTTVLAVLGVVSAVSDKIPYLSGHALFVGMLGLASFHVMATREGNSTVKMGVNAGVLFGMLANALEGGVTLSLTGENLVGNIGLLGLAFVAYEGINRFIGEIMG